MTNDFEDLSGIDPEVLAIMNENASTDFSLSYNTKNVSEVKPQRTNELAVKTNSLDSQGNILSVGDKVTIGNDKAEGRIIALGKYAKVHIKDEGDFDFPCSVLTLANNTVQQIQSSQPSVYSALTTESKVNRRETNDKFTSYTVESLMKAHTNDDYNNVSDTETFAMTERLQEIGGDGQPFNMGIN